MCAGKPAALLEQRPWSQALSIASREWEGCSDPTGRWHRHPLAGLSSEQGADTPAMSQVSPHNGQKDSAANMTDLLSSLTTKWPPAPKDQGLGLVVMYGLMEGQILKLKLQYFGHLI